MGLCYIMSLFLRKTVLFMLHYKFMLVGDVEVGCLFVDGDG